MPRGVYLVNTIADCSQRRRSNVDATVIRGQWRSSCKRHGARAQWRSFCQTPLQFSKSGVQSATPLRVHDTGLAIHDATAELRPWRGISMTPFLRAYQWHRVKHDATARVRSGVLIKLTPLRVPAVAFS